MGSTEKSNYFGFPDDWFYYEKTGPNSGWGTIRCFPPPDPNKLPEAILKNYGLFQRLLLSLRDFSHALSATTFIREDVDFEREYDLAELRRFQCYETALVVSYCRPFSESVGIPSLSYGKLGIKLSPFVKSLHEMLVSKRNRIFAHSDIGAVEQSQPVVMRSKDWQGRPFTVLLPPKFREGTLLTEAEFEQVSVLVSCVLTAVMRMIHAMHGNFSDRYPSMDLDLQ